MRYLTYPIFCGLIGAIIGFFFGSIFNIQYTKKSVRETQSTVLGIIGSGIGLFGGLALGVKLADEEKEKQRKESEYLKSLVSSTCEFCHQNFTFSTLEIDRQDYCNNGFSKISEEYKNTTREKNILYSQIDNLKRKHAIIPRLNKGKIILEKLLKYENVNLPILSPKPSVLIKNHEELMKQYS